MNRDSFDIKANRVHISLVHKDSTVHTGTIHMLQPLKYAGYFVVLRGFTYSSAGIEATIKVVRSPLHFPFFIAYGLFIVGLMASFLTNLPRVFNQ
jgi:hypothetical protein